MEARRVSEGNRKFPFVTRRSFRPLLPFGQKLDSASSEANNALSFK